MERGALALLALRPHRPVHELDEPLRDRQPEPCAAVATRRGRVDLAERGKQPIHPLLRDPDSRVAYRDVHAAPSRVGGFHIDVHDDLALLCELHRVREQVEEYLPQPGRVADDACRHVLVDQRAELDTLLRGPGSDDIERPFDALAHIERLLLEVELARLDLGIVEDVVDHVEQGVAARADDLGELALLRCQVGAE